MVSLSRQLKQLLSYLVRGISIVTRRVYCVLSYAVVGIAYGKTHPSNYISVRANIRNRDNIFLGRDFAIYPGATLWCTKFRAGNNVSINLGTHIFGDVTIGDHVMIAPNAVIAGGNHGIELNGTPMLLQECETKGIRIGNDVWIGANAVILDGVTIGDGAIVGAGSIVSRPVENNTIVAGNPAKVIRRRQATTS